MASFQASFQAGSSMAKPQAVPFSKKKNTDLSTRMDELFNFVFTSNLPNINDRVKANFKTPFQTLHYLQSLVSVVLGEQAVDDDDERRELAEDDVNQRFGPPSPSRATEQFWDHMHRCTPLTSHNESHIFSLQ